LGRFRGRCGHGFCPNSTNGGTGKKYRK